MIRLLRSVLCTFGVHSRPPGIDPALSLYWHCRACGCRVHGELALAKRRRR